MRPVNNSETELEECIELFKMSTLILSLSLDVLIIHLLVVAFFEFRVLSIYFLLGLTLSLANIVSGTNQSEGIKW